MSSTTSKSIRRVGEVALLCFLVATLAWSASVSAQQGKVYGSLRTYRAEADSAVIDGPTHDGVDIQVDLPLAQHVKNFGAPADGKGLCVFASMSMAARWHNVRQLEDVIHKVKEGGGWPSKVKKVIADNAPTLDVIQYEGADPAIMDKALAEDRAVCVTYGYGERYQMETIYHMVMLVHLDSKRAAILDNNFPGTYEWMSREEFLRRWVHPKGQGWAFVMLAPPPPPPPHN